VNSHDRMKRILLLLFILAVMVAVIGDILFAVFNETMQQFEVSSF